MQRNVRVFHRPTSEELSVSSTFAPGRELFVELKVPHNDQLLLFQNVAAATVCTAVRMYQADFFSRLARTCSFVCLYGAVLSNRLLRPRNMLQSHPFIL